MSRFFALVFIAFFIGANALTPLELVRLIEDSSRDQSSLNLQSVSIFLETTADLKTRGLNARSYKSDVSGEIFVVFGGTTTIQDIITFDREILFNELPNDYKLAERFTGLVADKIRKDGLDLSKRVYLGYSLGAYLAEVAAVTQNIPCISFESPGTREILREKFKFSNEALDNYNVVKYFSQFNPVNSHIQQIGKSFIFLHTKPLQDEETTYYSKLTQNPLSIFVLGSLTSHQASNFLQAIDTQSGQIINPIVYNEWPESIYQGYHCYFLDYNRNTEFWDEIITFGWANKEGTEHFKSFEAYRHDYIKQKLDNAKRRGCKHGKIGLLIEGFDTMVSYSNELFKRITKNFPVK